MYVDCLTRGFRTWFAYTKIGSSKSVAGRDGGRRSGVGVVGVDVGEECAHDSRHARTEVLGRQTVEMAETSLYFVPNCQRKRVKQSASEANVYTTHYQLIAGL